MFKDKINKVKDKLIVIVKKVAKYSYNIFNIIKDKAIIVGNKILGFIKDKLIFLKSKFKNINLKEDKFSITIVCVVVVLFIVIVRNSLAKDEIYANVDVNNVLMGTNVLYMDNTDYNECKFCNKARVYLDDKGINYKYYNVASVSDDKFKEDLELLGIDEELFGTPALIYIEDGRMFANIINISDTDVIDSFIKDYSLDKLK